ncbi:2Fe-2S iron-sulfur cluster-binding protein [Kyrpidia tusciae]|uniref:Ferredoxin n=1 Tax=Kyrpidia tusciae (strain DSM 2912 / NBRC 15312 / T2) TaxID=562970 RepID=D5WW65_KYRT2|nr:2Fe-2S iron-sulfur cluster-binding protein [Kyrpidia tusciae]ADG05697.1 ferredoxin [Kyrpidia tusciae DSM 2912]MBE3552117.1 2Fe-2S iron-sulfur cluster binding domain-containing protein [Kyrpidia tusciae]
MADGYRITVLGKGREFTCNHDQDVLAAAVAQGVRSIKRGCRGGGCGLCKVRVVEGSYELGKTSVAVLPRDERERGFVLTCKTTPKSDLVIRLTEDS